MPYRRLPNTDTARIRALKTAIEKCLNTDFREVAIEMKTLQEAKNVLSRFERIYNPVSYTHLDVYKRQVYPHIKYESTYKGAMLVSGRPEHRANMS